MLIGSGGIPWSVTSASVSGASGVLTALPNEFLPDAATVLHYPFEDDVTAWAAELPGSVRDNSGNGRHGDPMLAYAATSPAAGGDWVGQALHLDLTPWKDPHGTVRVPVGGLTIPRATPFTVQWWMRVNSLSRFDGGVFSPNVLDDDAWNDNYLRCYCQGSTETLWCWARNGNWTESDENRGKLAVPFAAFMDSEWHHFRFVNEPWAEGPDGYNRYLYVDGVLQDSFVYSAGWTRDFTLGADLYLGHYNNNVGADDRPYQWEAGIDADFDDFVLQAGVIDDVPSRWRYDTEAFDCVSTQTVTLAEAQRLMRLSFIEAAPVADERLQCVEVDDGTGAGFQTVYTYGDAGANVSALQPAAAFTFRIMQRLSTDGVHAYPHVLQALALDLGPARLPSCNLHGVVVRRGMTTDYLSNSLRGVTVRRGLTGEIE